MLVASTLRDSDGGRRVLGDTRMGRTRLTSGQLASGPLNGANVKAADQRAVRSQQMCAKPSRPAKARLPPPRRKRTLGALAGGVKEVVAALFGEALSDGGRRKTEHGEAFLSILRVISSTVNVGGQGTVKRG